MSGFYSAGLFDVIPDSVALQYSAETFEEGEGWEDDTGTADMSVSGLSTTTLSDGSDGVQGDGTDDHGLVDIPSSLEGSELSDFALEFRIESTTSDFTRLFGTRNDGEEPSFQVFSNVDEAGSGDSGNIKLRIDDEDGNEFHIAFDEAPDLFDGNVHTVTFDVVDITDNSECRVFFDGDEETIATGPDDISDPSGISWQYDIGHYARNDRGSIDQHFEGAFNIIRWHDVSTGPTLD